VFSFFILYGYPRHPEIHYHFLSFVWVLASEPPSAKLSPRGSNL